MEALGLQLVAQVAVVDVVVVEVVEREPAAALIEVGAREEPEERARLYPEPNQPSQGTSGGLCYGHLPT